MDKIIEGKKLPTYKYIASWEGKIFNIVQNLYDEKKEKFELCVCVWETMREERHKINEQDRNTQEDVYITKGDKINMLQSRWRVLYIVTLFLH